MIRDGTLPLADAGVLRGPARRTAAVRAALAAAALLALATAYLVAPGGDLARAFAADGRGSIVVLDVSGSIGDNSSAQIRRLLADEIRSAGPDGHVGLVLFSDVAMEALPPTAPASALASFRRFFVPLQPQRTAAAAGPTPSSVLGLRYEQSPWGAALTGGTSVSTGLREAREALRRAGLDGGRVLLLSDLVDSPVDARALRKELVAYASDPRLDLQVRALPTPVGQSLALYRRILGPHAVRSARSAPAPRFSSRAAPPLPLALLALAGFAALLLAAHELLVMPLRWGVQRGAKA